MGKCITVIKVIGASSLGLATTALGFSSLSVIPDLIANDTYSVPEFTSRVKKLIYYTRSLVLTFGTVASLAFFVAYDYSAVRGKHPYLIYAALGFPLSLVSYFFGSYPNEDKLLQLTHNFATAREAVPLVEKKDKKEHLHSNLDNSVYQDLGRTSSQEETEDDDAVEIEDKVHDVILEKESKLSLANLKRGYHVAGGLIGSAFAIAAIGLVGDKY